MQGMTVDGALFQLPALGQSVHISFFFRCFFIGCDTGVSRLRYRKAAKAGIMRKPDMRKPDLRRQTHGSSLVDSVAKLEALATLLQKPAASIKLDTLFSTRASGWRNCNAFHIACDNKGPTLVLISATDGVAFGGYASVSWTSCGNYVTDVSAFLFRIEHFSGGAFTRHLLPQKFARSGSINDVYHAASCGPVFGSGHDLLTFNQGGIQMTCAQGSFNTSGPLFSANAPQTQPFFLPAHANAGGVTEARFEMEVLQVSALPANIIAELAQPWMPDLLWTAEVVRVCFSTGLNTPRDSLSSLHLMARKGVYIYR